MNITGNTDEVFLNSAKRFFGVDDPSKFPEALEHNMAKLDKTFQKEDEYKGATGHMAHFPDLLRECYEELLLIAPSKHAKAYLLGACKGVLSQDKISSLTKRIRGDESSAAKANPVVKKRRIKCNP